MNKHEDQSKSSKYSKNLTENLHLFAVEIPYVKAYTSTTELTISTG